MNAEAKLARIRELHAEFRIYDECGHQHEIADDVTVHNIPDVGFVCDDGYQFSICRECCVDGDYQTEACTYHPHEPGLPWCDTRRILDEDD